MLKFHFFTNLLELNYHIPAFSKSIMGQHRKVCRFKLLLMILLNGTLLVFYKIEFDTQATFHNLTKFQKFRIIKFKVEVDCHLFVSVLERFK